MRLYFLTSISGLTSLQALKTFCYIFKAFFFNFMARPLNFLSSLAFSNRGSFTILWLPKIFIFGKCEHKGKSFKVETSWHVMLVNVIENK